MALDFKILRGNRDTLLNEDGSPKIPPEKLVNGYWYLTNDTAEVFVCLLDPTDGITLKLFKINDCGATSWDESRIEDIESRLETLEEESDVVTYRYRHLFPTQGEANKLYVDADTGTSYIWFDNDYMVVGGSTEVEMPDIIFGGNATATTEDD